ncbi:MAG TPA: MaoC family dehydratase [Gammaproteobacteria bacterium]|nr:MaoC family dehydratase [Gammaproteobacteria bacterium]
MSIREGDPGNFYEDFQVGDIHRHRLGRTVTQNDNIWFTMVTVNPNPIHFDEHYAARTNFGKPLVNSTFTLALVTGLTVNDISRNGINLGWDNVRLPNPLFEGETVYAQTEILDKRESNSRRTVGIVRCRTTGYKADGTVVITFERNVMVYKREHAPQHQNPAPEGGQEQT